MNKHFKIAIFFLIMLMSLPQQGHAMTTQGNQIINTEGQPIELKGVNWFGFNNQQSMVDGLWGGTDSITLDFSTVVYRMQLLGYNAVRLPFSFKDLYNLPPRNFSRSCTIASQSQIQASVTNPSVPVPPGKTIPPMVAPAPRQPGMCSDYLPNTSTLQRFLWVVNFFAKSGFYVLIDNHLREDQTVLEDQAKWVRQWSDLVAAISEDPISRDKLMIDILNEPDNFGLRWEASGGKPGIKDLYLKMMDAVYPINPKALFLIEGAGQGGIDANWGDGFATDPAIISQFGLSDPNPFFQTLLSKPYVNQVVISPHVYPPSVTHASKNFTGEGLWNRLSSSFGYFTQKGYCAGGKCKVFPVAIGEFGSRFTEQNDIASMNDMARYFNNSGAAADGKHQKIPNWFYWSWNANSGDTGGIVEDNWRDIVWRKIDYLTTIGLTPWYLGSAPELKYGTLCVKIAPVSGLSASDLKPIIAGDYTFQVTDFNKPVCQKVTTGSYTITAPRILIGNQQYDAVPVTVSVAENQEASITITYKATTIVQGVTTIAVQLGTPWEEKPGVFRNVLNLYIKNTSGELIEAPWTLRLSNPGYLAVPQVWNILPATIDMKGTITAKTDPKNKDWQKLLPNGGNVVNVGMIVSSSSQNFMPTSASINGQKATLTLMK